MTGRTEMLNPFPGLRSFGAEESHLFFGREQIVDQLLMRLRGSRFLGVIGSSGCGKSSLVRAGMIPSLHGGYMAGTGSSWRVALMRPGNDPIGNLAMALSESDILGQQAGISESSSVLTEVTLRRSNLGLVDCVRLASLPQEDNLLIVVDQFEELFRFKHRGESENARDEAVAFVKRLLSATEQQELPIYVVLTMRSDFIGECIEYPGLPEAINEGQFLVPRMTRDQLRSAIAGPILVAGGEIAPRLLVRLLNDVGDDPDRLPVLQHALMRAWNYWAEVRVDDEPIDIQHYEAIGTIEHALSSHADEAYDELASDQARSIAAKVFKALTDTTTDNRGVRRPTTVDQLRQIAKTSVEDLVAVIDVFRKPGRSFLMPPIDIVLEPNTFIDIAHESLMRVWSRLIAWTQEENASTRNYMRLARTAARYEQGRGGLLHDPDLEIALQWRKAARPTPAWATRHDPAFEQAMSFLDESKAERDRQVEERRKARRNKLQMAWGVSLALLVFAMYAFFQQQRAEQEQQRAQQNFQLAVRAVDEMLNDVAIEESLADIPQTEELRQQLLEKARMFFEALREDPAADPNLRVETALAQSRLGNIYQYQGQRDKAKAAHLEGISQLRILHEEFEDQPLYQYHLAEAYNWLGEQLRSYDGPEAEKSYNNALELQLDLVDKDSDNLEYRYELGRTYNNRGILIGNYKDRIEEAEESFTESIRLFEGVRNERDDPLDSLRIARTKNNLGKLFREHNRDAEAEKTFTEAIELMKELVNAYPDKRAYREGLASMYNNLGNYFLVRRKLDLALESNTEARRLFESLATPAHGLRVEIANSHNTRGRILAGFKNRTQEAAEAYEIALLQFEQLEKEAAEFSNDPGLNQRFGNAIANFAILKASEQQFGDALVLAARAIEYYRNAVNSGAPIMGSQRSLASAYWLLADIGLKSGEFVDVVDAIEDFAATTPDSGTLYEAAVLYARALKLARNDAALTDAERGRIEEAYGLRTVELLGKAIAGGYSLIRLEGDVDRKFSHLQNREDFQRLLSGAP